MNIVISRKPVTKWRCEPAEDKYDLAGLIRLMATPTASVTMRAFENEIDSDAFITKQVAMGMVCHQFNYIESFKASMSIESSKVAA